jgi:hypothetical protein
VKYVHLAPESDFPVAEGRCTLLKEKPLTSNGRKILYIVGHVVVEASCTDGSCVEAVDCLRALVPGYVVSDKTETDEQGRPVSQVEPVTDVGARVEIGRAILNAEDVSDVEFL